MFCISLRRIRHARMHHVYQSLYKPASIVSPAKHSRVPLRSGFSALNRHNTRLPACLFRAAHCPSPHQFPVAKYPFHSSIIFEQSYLLQYMYHRCHPFQLIFHEQRKPEDDLLFFVHTEPDTDTSSPLPHPAYCRKYHRLRLPILLWWIENFWFCLWCHDERPFLLHKHPQHFHQFPIPPHH